MNTIFAHDHIIYKYQDNYYSNGGLSAEAIKRYTKTFDKVTLLTRQKNINEQYSKLIEANVSNSKFIKIPNYKNIENIYKFHESKKIIKNHVKRCDSLIARLPSSIGSIAINYAKKYDKPYLIELVGCPWDSLWNHSIKGKFLAPFVWYKTKKIVNEAPYVIYVTKEFLQERYPTKGKSTNCSNVLLEDFDNEILANRIKKIDNYKPDEVLTIGTIGSVNIKYKGQEFVIKAISYLKEKGINKYKYQLVGGGDNSYLKNIAKDYKVYDKIEFLGTMPHENIFDWLKNIDMYVQPSTTEGLPRSLIEAMSKALPSLGSNAGGIPELLEDKYIFQKGEKGINEISNILSSINIKDMKKQSKKNYNESKKYKKMIIEKRRKDFFEMFIEDIKTNKT